MGNTMTFDSEAFWQENGNKLEAGNMELLEQNRIDT